jgi:hypothetical protein
MKKTGKILAFVIVIAALSLQGCAVFKKKCDCPKFGYHHSHNRPPIFC